MDGEWEPPLINNPKCEDRSGCGPWSRPLMKNPKYKGKWKQPLIDNPNYRGKWTPRLIPNPDYFYDKTPLKSSPIVSICNIIYMTLKTKLKTYEQFKIFHLIDY